MLKMINGFTVIAHRWSDFSKEDFVILAVRPVTVDSTRYEYVTARIHTMASTEWYWGHYFTNDVASATLDYLNR